VAEEGVRQDRKKEGSVILLPEIPLPPQPLLTSSKFADALNVAERMFADKARKGTNIPYISHLLGTCSIALEHGATEDEAIAALLHDTIEDIKPTDEARAAVEHFGREVLRIVKACSDSDTHPKPPWQERKERYLDRLAREDHAVLLVSASDKLHNARSIASDLRHHGSSIWDRFNAPREKQLWYYRELVKIFGEHLVENPALVAELDMAVTEMERP
jgi:GTP pyrophosphokinase